MRPDIVRCYSSECATRTLHVCLKSSGCHRPSAAKLGAGAVDTGGITRLAVSFDLVDVAPNSLPPLDLPRVLVRHAATNVVAAVPLEPAARIVRMNPALAAPDRQRLAGIDAEIIHEQSRPDGESRARANQLAGNSSR